MRLRFYQQTPNNLVSESADKQDTNTVASPPTLGLTKLGLHVWFSKIPFPFSICGSHNGNYEQHRLQYAREYDPLHVQGLYEGWGTAFLLLPEE
jgi:hypothetical protein